MVLGVAWMGFLIAGGLWVKCHPRDEKPSEKPKPERYAAAHDMPANYRIGKLDLKWSDSSETKAASTRFMGKHLAHDVRNGEMVVVEDLRAKPIVKPAPGKEVFSLSLLGRPDLIDTLNAGLRIDLFQNDQVVLRQIPILAVQCDPPETPNCVVWLGLDANEAQHLGHIELAKLRLLTVSRER
jgi:hypothetical protein